MKSPFNSLKKGQDEMGTAIAIGVFNMILNAPGDVERTVAFNTLAEREATRVAMYSLLDKALIDPELRDEAIKIDFSASKVNNKYCITLRKMETQRFVIGTAPDGTEEKIPLITAGMARSFERILRQMREDGHSTEDIKRMRTSLYSLEFNEPAMSKNDMPADE